MILFVTFVFAYLLDVDEVIAVLCKVGSDGPGVCRLVAGDLVILEDLGETSDVHREDGEVAGCRLSRGDA